MTAKDAKPLLAIGAFILIGAVLILATEEEPDPMIPPHAPMKPADKLARDDLAYLLDNWSVSWYEVEGGEVHIGFKFLAPDPPLGTVIKGAALRGYRATGQSFRAWGVDASHGTRPWRPGDLGYICFAQARGDRITKSDCPQ